MKILKRLLTRIKGERTKETYGSVKPTGIRVTYVPSVFIDDNTKPIWDEHLFDNKIKV